MYYHFKVHHDEDALWAECVELEGCQTQSKDNTIADLRLQMSEALNAYLDEPEASRTVFPYPKNSVKGETIERVAVDPQIAFAMLVRQYRIEHHLTQREMALNLGYKNLSAYQKLEKKGNPKLSTIVNIKKNCPDIPFEQYLIE
jgi:DNA-binding XRE family transcriptional regulator